ncbi:MAG: helix-turn-helix domain-containing protein [Candidatus Omnitrophica bacterium]|nr:helix-turn-helix domain-containing protein [Candidatus Omnitrophota bacterium]
MAQNQPSQSSKRTQIMTLKEVSKYLGVHPVTVYRLIKETNIPAIKLRGQWRFKKDLLDEWLMDGMDKKRMLKDLE